MTMIQLTGAVLNMSRILSAALSSGILGQQLKDGAKPYVLIPAPCHCFDWLLGSQESQDVGTDAAGRYAKCKAMPDERIHFSRQATPG